MIKTVYEEAGVELPRLTFVLVTKNSSARFFQKQKKDAYTNPQVGIVVDNTVTFPGK